MSRQHTSGREEQISAMLDDHLDQNELDAFMQDLRRDPVADTECIRRYQIMGDALHDDLNAASFMDISAAVRCAIEQEAELHAVPTVESASSAVFDLSRLLSGWSRPLTGMAIAASVAMVTVVSFRTVETNSTDNPAQMVADARSDVNKSSVEPVNPLLVNQLRPVSTLEAKSNAQLQAKQLSDYMIRHSGYAGQTTMQGMMPYVRVVGFDSNQQK